VALRWRLKTLEGLKRDSICFWKIDRKHVSHPSIKYKFPYARRQVFLKLFNKTLKRNLDLLIKTLLQWQKPVQTVVQQKGRTLRRM
jgi:hypothetical protein